MTRAARTERRARQLLRCYPRAWRQRYGEEFAALLVADLTERPHAVARTLDVVRGGALARLTYAGLAGDVLDTVDRRRASLAALVCCIAVFLAFGFGQWSQIAIDWQWAAPDPPAVAVAMKVMTAALLALLALAAAAAAPIGWCAMRAACSQDGRRLRPALVLLAVGAVVLVVGARHVASGWPGTGGRDWAGKGLVPAPLAAFAWAATLSVNAYWAHPGSLGAFPAFQLAWMIVAPIAISCVVAGAATTVRRVRISPRVLAYEARVAAAATVAMLVFLGAAACRLLEPETGPRKLFAIGLIDVVDVLVMAAALAAALAVARRARPGAALR